jgi:hypothetical protein
MFNNNVKLVAGAASASNKDTTLIDGPTNRKTLRSSASGELSFSLAHQESNENPGFTTQRSNVRVQLSKEVADTDKTVNAYAQLTISHPKETVTALEVRELIAFLVNFLQYGDLADGTEAIMEASGAAACDRLIAGEP